MRMLKPWLLLALGSLPMFGQFDAQVSITYVPVTATPTLSETMLVALGLLLPVVAYRSLRSLGSRTAASLSFAGLLGLEALTGSRMLPRANAFVGFAMSNPAGGTISNIPIIAGGNSLIVNNTSGVTMLLQSVVWSNLTGGTPQTGAGYCTQGVTVPSPGSCLLNLIPAN